MRSTLFAGLAALAICAVPCAVKAQALGPQRQFLALEPIYTYTRLDDGAGAAKLPIHAYGGRLWLNLAPFSGPAQNLIGRTTLGLYMQYTPRGGIHGVSFHQYGADANIHFVDYPVGGLLDPYLIVGGSALRIHSTRAVSNFTRGTVTRPTASPGLGFRVQLGNRLQLRGEGKDLIIFSNRSTTGQTRTSNNLQITGSLGLTF